jgi:hypothetical protein
MFQAILADPAVPRALIPPQLKWLGPLGPMLVRANVRAALAKYACPVDTAKIRASFEQLDAAVGGKRAYLVGTQLSFAGTHQPVGGAAAAAPFRASLTTARAAWWLSHIAAFALGSAATSYHLSLIEGHAS